MNKKGPVVRPFLFARQSSITTGERGLQRDLEIDIIFVKNSQDVVDVIVRDD